MTSHLLAGTFLNFNYYLQRSQCPSTLITSLLKLGRSIRRELCNSDTLINHADKTSMNHCLGYLPFITIYTLDNITLVTRSSYEIALVIRGHYYQSSHCPNDKIAPWFITSLQCPRLHQTITVICQAAEQSRKDFISFFRQKPPQNMKNMSQVS